MSSTRVSFRPSACCQYWGGQAATQLCLFRGGTGSVGFVPGKHRHSKHRIDKSLIATSSTLPIDPRRAKTSITHTGFPCSSRRLALLAPSTLGWVSLFPGMGSADSEGPTEFALFESGQLAPPQVQCLKAIKSRKQGALTDLSNFVATEPLVLGGYTIKGVQYSFWAPRTFSPVSGFLDNGPDPTGTLDMRLEDTSLGTIIVAAPQVLNAKWAGKQSIEEVGSPREVLAALSNSKLLDTLVDTEIFSGPDGRTYYQFELLFKSPPAVHRLLTATVLDGQLILLTVLAGGFITGKQPNLWKDKEFVYRQIAASFRVQEAPAPKPID
eukprot:CAMPEP_0114232728 /NCGR_PEP_ID=MMETSP0058-20121206/4773_1 /TAXON_ID=36894 /ORGANISM="Pyramimonas parkeae, CCMP726" /LENGTH=324 /DNA_ID=CAMNT_0001344245 /DNA_START=107 /DNA_END=1081 /DNA_ORIENTATION=+